MVVSTTDSTEERADRLMPFHVPVLTKAVAALRTHRTDVVPVIAIFLLAYALRLVYLLQIAKSPFFDLLDLDPLYYHQWAQSIVSGDWLGREVFEQSPLYPYLLAAFMFFFGDDLWLLRLVQIGMGSLTCVFTYLLGQQLFGRRSGIVAGVGAALYAPFYFYEGQVMKEFLTPLLAAASLWLLVRKRPPSSLAVATSGALLGLAALVRDNFLLLLPALAAWLVYERRGTLRYALILFAGALAVLCPVGLRNYAVSGDFVLTTSGGGEVFYIGNGPYANGGYAPPPWVHPHPPVEHEDFRRKADELSGRELTRAEASRFWWQQGLSWIARNPVSAAAIWATKFVLFWNDRELPDNYSFYTFRRLSWLLGHLLTFGPVAALGWAGLILAFRDRAQPMPVYIAMGAYMLSVLIVFNFARFRLPIVVMLLPFAGAFVTAFASAVRQCRTAGLQALRPFTGVAAVLLVSGPLFWPNTSGLEVEYAGDRVRLAVAHWQHGRLEEAEGEARAAISELEAREEQPQDNVAADNHESAWATAHRLIATVLLERKEPDRAANEFQHILDRTPRDSKARLGLAETLRAGGKWEAAVTAYRQAIEDDPANFDARLRLASLYSEMRYPKKALEMLNGALLATSNLTSDDVADYHYTTASVLSSIPGRERDAASHLATAARLAPGRSEALAAQRYLRLVVGG